MTAPACPHGLTRPCVRCDPWTPCNVTEASLDEWQAYVDTFPHGPHRVDVGHGITLVYERTRTRSASGRS